MCFDLMGTAIRSGAVAVWLGSSACLFVSAQQPAGSDDGRPPATDPLVKRPELKPRASTALKLRPYPKLSSEDLAKEIAVLIPLVERVVGRRFLVPPVVRTADDTSWAALVAAERPRVKDRALAGATTFALYLPERDEVVLGGFLAFGLGREGERGCWARALLAHELAHVLQDQHFALPSRLRVETDAWSQRVLRALTEGHAALVEERVATLLGVADAESKLRRRYRRGEGLFYIRGRDYLARVERDGGVQAVVQALVSKLPTPVEFARKSAPPKSRGRPSVGDRAAKGG
ncbi:MAG: hypothetical protein AB8H80_21105 [Planctomycetota bacterium]